MHDVAQASDAERPRFRLLVRPKSPKTEGAATNATEVTSPNACEHSERSRAPESSSQVSCLAFMACVFACLLNGRYGKTANFSNFSERSVFTKVLLCQLRFCMYNTVLSILLCKL